MQSAFLSALLPSIYHIMNVKCLLVSLSKVLVDRCFHGDIHGGNLLLLKDGRLGLIGIIEHFNNNSELKFSFSIPSMSLTQIFYFCIFTADMGQVKTLSEDEVENLCQTYLLVKAGDKAGLKEAAIGRGYRSKYLDENVIYNMTRFALDSDGPEVCV